MKTKILNIVRRWTGYFDLQNEITILQQQLKEQQQYSDLLNDDLEQLRHKYQLSKEKIEELILKETLPIQDLKDWYEDRRDQRPWEYNGRRLGYTDVKNYIKTKDITEFTKLAKQLTTKYKITNKHSPTQIVTFAYKYWNLIGSWTYKTDLQLHKQEEYWEDAADAILTRVGDCETKAMCIYWTILELFKLHNKSKHSWRLTFTAAVVNSGFGHAILTWLHNDGEYYVIESTFDENNSKYKTWLRTPMRYNNMYGAPWGFATHERSWKGSNSALLSFRDEEVSI